MHLQRLHIQRIRNLEAVALTALQPFNIFYGNNGSGKTSILEAIHVLATGRSFRTHIPKQYLQHHAQDALIFAQSEQDKIGIQKHSSGEQLIKVNGDTLATQGQLAKLLPLQHLDPQSSDVLDHGAKARRQMLDWLMFHVEPEFYPLWQGYARALKQRNRLLKSSRNLSLAELAPWNQLLSDFGERLHQQRLDIIARWQLFLAQDLAELLPNLDIKMDYSAGFHSELGLLHDLQQHHQKDIERRYTEYGPHRADLRFKTALGPADEVLSRGQKKLLMMALKLSQIAMLHASQKQTVVLLDDITAELDLAAQQRLLARLSHLGSQVFLTTLEQNAVEQHLQTLSVNYQFFQVEQGQVSATSASHVPLQHNTRE